MRVDQSHHDGDDDVHALHAHHHVCGGHVHRRDVHLPLHGNHHALRGRFPPFQRCDAHHHVCGGHVHRRDVHLPLHGNHHALRGRFPPFQRCDAHHHVCGGQHVHHYDRHRQIKNSDPE